MRVIDSLEAVPDDLAPSAVTIGKFDGVHAGHQAVLRQLLAVAGERSLTPVVVTFDRHPLELFAPDSCPESLMSLTQKLELLAANGAEAVLVAPFDRQFAALSAEEFAQRVLVEALGARAVLVGADFRFGARGAGDLATLRDLGARHGFDVVLVDDVGDDAGRASSTRIRALLGEGRVREAAALLGREHAVRSVVVRGEQRGRELGYPTANLHPAIEGLVPADGVYAGWLVVDGERHPAAISVGNNPTFDGVPERQVEAHAIDRDFDLYGRTVEVVFVEHLRGMVRFDGIEPLMAQIADDVSRATDLLARE